MGMRGALRGGGDSEMLAVDAALNGSLFRPQVDQGGLFLNSHRHQAKTSKQKDRPIR